LLNLALPLYNISNQVTPENRRGVATLVPLFLCPSDSTDGASSGFGPLNYAACTGDGDSYGTPFNTNGLFYINSRVRLRDIIDGTSKTIAISESLLGAGSEPMFAALGTLDVQTMYAYTGIYTGGPNPPLTEEGCKNAAVFNMSNRRGFSWANGEYRCGLYNHEMTPNENRFDCVSTYMTSNYDERYAAAGWRAARSRHSGGVNTLYADSSVRWASDDIAIDIWRALSTRAGNELVE
jgi:prepilin-type processing-associated H-X9-DG protein